MKKNTKGFTLVEILTVIAIVAIIALITIPVTNIIIKSVKKSTFETSVNNMMETIDWYILDEYNGKVNTEKIFDLSTGGITEVKAGATGEFLKYDGVVIGRGQIKVNSVGEYYVNYSNGTFCAVKEYSDPDLTISEGECN